MKLKKKDGGKIDEIGWKTTLAVTGWEEENVGKKITFPRITRTNMHRQILCSALENYSLAIYPMHVRQPWNICAALYFWDLRFPQWWKFRFGASGLWYRAVWYKITNLSEENTASSFTVHEESSKYLKNDDYLPDYTVSCSSFSMLLYNTFSISTILC